MEITGHEFWGAALGRKRKTRKSTFAISDSV
jgi:hypothetical protein